VPIALPYQFSINSINFTSDNVGYLVCQSFHDYGQGGDLFKTVDGGISWYHYSSVSLYPTYRVGLNSAYFYNDLTGYVVGNLGTILRTTNGGNIIGLTNLARNLPQAFSLHQNYPNPFNPTTKIRFDIPSLVRRGAGVVVLKIYDLLGREVATLVNEQLKPGTYEVEWPAPTGDGSSFASGVYFYTLTTNEFTETKRMVLIK